MYYIILTSLFIEGDFEYTLFMAPVATDYETYGLVYVCQKTPHVGGNFKKTKDYL